MPRQATHSVAAPNYPPGDLAIWIFILAELLVFAVFFAAYAFTRMNHVELFNEYQATLNRDAALINTLGPADIQLLRDARRGCGARRQQRFARAGYVAAVAMGVVFVVVKSAEYAHHLGAGVGLSTNTFYMFYLSLTFFHFMHVILGMVILVAVAVKARGDGYSVEDHTGVETGASYWHMVDPVVVDLVPLVYVDAMNGIEPTRQLIRPCTLVYAVLMLLTVVTWGIGRAGLKAVSVYP